MEQEIGLKTYCILSLHQMNEILQTVSRTLKFYRNSFSDKNRLSVGTIYEENLVDIVYHLSSPEWMELN